MTTRRNGIAIVAALITAFALLLTWGAANAQQPPERATRLEPGLNFVGWVGEPTPVSQLFREIPQLESIWAWDAELRDWIVAAPDAPEWLGGLGRVSAGMGLRMQIGGDQPVDWRRSTEPTRGLVKLHTGWNLVAWSGIDETPINDAVKGIGWSLRTVRRWNPATQQWSIWTSPERSAQLIANAGDDSEMPDIRRGEALWIEVARAVNWLQPTGILPNLVFPGGASQQVRQAAERLAGQFLTSFRAAFGFEMDASRYDIWMPASVEALRRAALVRGIAAEHADSLITLWDVASGWVDSFTPGHWTIVIRQQPQATWDTWGLLAHEYFHVVQSQLSEGSAGASLWVTEGTAEWAEDVYLVASGDELWPNLRSQNSNFARDYPLLEDLSFGNNGWWPYQFGWLATDQLIEQAGADSWIELWRRLAPSGAGPHRRWQSTPRWEDIFHEVAGVDLPAFSNTFAAWAREQTQQGSSNNQTTQRIRGRVTDASGRPVEGMRVTATRTAGDPAGDLTSLESAGWTRATTTPNGSFEIAAAHSNNYRISLDLGDCTRHYSNGELISDWWETRPIRVSQSGISGINIQLPPDVCAGPYIRGTALGPNAEPLAGIHVRASGATARADDYTTPEGSFAVLVPASGEYRLRLHLGNGCNAWYTSARPTSEQDRASVITVGAADVEGITIEVPVDMCVYQIKGSIAQVDGQPLADTEISACLEQDRDCIARAHSKTNNDGAFAITVPTEGAYRLELTLDECTIYFRGGGLTAADSERLTVRVDGRDVRLSPRQIPEGMCTHQIRGRIIQSDGQPLTRTYVTACLEVDGDCVSWSTDNTGDDGAFAVTVPVDGAYRLRFNLGSCQVYFGQDRLSTNSDDARLIHVAGQNVQLRQQQLPAEICAYQITGRIAQADGRPLAGAHVFACLEQGNDCAAQAGTLTDNGGAFAITVPAEGRYAVGFDLEGCMIYFRGDGLTTTFGERSTVRVEGRSVSLTPRRITADMCAYRISGRLVDSNNAPLAEKQINAHWLDGLSGALTDANGRFEIRVPSDGAYAVSIDLRAQPRCWHEPADRSLGSRNNPIRVSGANVTGITLRLPATIEKLCN